MGWKSLFGGSEASTTDDVLRQAEENRAADQWRSGRPSARATAPGDQLAAVVTLIREGKQLDAIKLYRAQHHVGLKEAKDAVDAISAGRAPAVRTPQAVSAAPPANEGDIDALLQQDRFIEAIKVYRERYGTSLVVAKDAVEARRAQLLG